MSDFMLFVGAFIDGALLGALVASNPAFVAVGCIVSTAALVGLYVAAVRR